MRFFQLLAGHECIEGREHGLCYERRIMVNDGHLFGTTKENGRANVSMCDNVKIVPDTNTEFIKRDERAISHHIVCDDQPIGPNTGHTFKDIPG